MPPSAADATAPPPAAAEPVSAELVHGPVRTLVHAWLLIDFFGDSRRTGQPGSTLTTTIFGQAFFALVLAVLLFPDTRPVPFAAATLSLSTLFVALGFLGDDHGARRMRADRMLLATSPLTRLQLTAAYALHASFYIVLTTVGMAIPPAVLLAHLADGSWRAAVAYVALACVCAGMFAAAVALLQRAVASALGRLRAALFAGTFKAVLLGGAVVAFATCLRHLDRGLDGLPLPSWLVMAWPPLWAARLLGPGPWTTPALVLIGSGAVLLALAWLAVSGAEPRAQARVQASRLLAGVQARLARGRRRVLAVAAFTGAHLLRSPGFRGKVLPLFGMPAAMLLLAWSGDGGQRDRGLLAVAAQLPAIYLPFLVGFLPFGDHPRARWLFDSGPTLGEADVRGGVWVALVSHVLLPAHVLLALALFAGLPWPTATATAAFAVATSLLSAKLAARRLTGVPFSSDDEGVTLDHGSLLTTAILLTVAALLFDRIVGSVAVAALAVAAAAGTLLATAPPRIPAP